MNVGKSGNRAGVASRSTVRGRGSRRRSAIARWSTVGNRRQPVLAAVARPPTQGHSSSSPNACRPAAIAESGRSPSFNGRFQWAEPASVVVPDLNTLSQTLKHCLLPSMARNSERRTLLWRDNRLRDKVAVFAQGRPRRPAGNRRAVGAVHSNFLDACHHRAHVVGKPGRPACGHLSFEDRHIAPP